MRPAAFARVLERHRPGQPHRLYEIRSVVPDVADLLVDRPEPPNVLRCRTQQCMAILIENFYRWQLVVDTATGCQLVRHEPNLASGGKITEVDVQTFLERTGSSPENLALRQVLEKPRHHDQEH